MIITRTPLRMSFVGGGSDLASYYQKHGGAVISTSINKFIYLCANNKFEKGYRLSYSKQEIVERVDQIEHQLFRHCLDYFNIKDSFEISSMADIPSSGSGLGSSSSFTVGLVNLLSSYLQKELTKEEIANIACEIEIDICGNPIGKQDQYAASFGGLNKIIFNRDGSTNVIPINCKPENLKKFKDSIIVLYTGKSREANQILSIQNEKMNEKSKQEIVTKMVDLCDPFSDLITEGNIEGIGEVLDYGWNLKKSILETISNSSIDILYDRGKKAGAFGGKLMGAGGQGFLLFCAPKDRHSSIKEELKELRELDISFDQSGTQVVYKDA